MFIATSRRRSPSTDIVTVDNFAYLQNFSIRQLVHSPSRWNIDLFADFFRETRAYPVNVAKADLNALIRRDVHTRYTCHVVLVVFKLSWSECPLTPK